MFDAITPGSVSMWRAASAGGILVDGVLTIDLEIREGEWFPEDDHGPSIKVFAMAEKGKPAQIPGPMIRIPQGTEIHVIVDNLITTDVSIHGMHTRPGKNDDTFEVPGGSTFVPKWTKAQEN